MSKKVKNWLTLMGICLSFLCIIDMYLSISAVEQVPLVLVLKVVGGQRPLTPTKE